MRIGKEDDRINGALARVITGSLFVFIFLKKVTYLIEHNSSGSGISLEAE